MQYQAHYSSSYYNTTINQRELIIINTVLQSNKSTMNNGSEHTIPLLHMENSTKDAAKESNTVQPCQEDAALLNTFTMSSTILGIVLGIAFESLSWVSHVSLLAASSYVQPSFAMDLGCTVYHLCLLPLLVLECLRYMLGSLVGLISPVTDHKSQKKTKELCDQLFLHVQSRFAIGFLLGVLVTLSVVDICLDLRHHICVVFGVFVVLLAFFAYEKRLLDEECTIKLLAARNTGEKDTAIPTF